MANPQTDNGYTKIAHELLETVQQYKFSLNEMKIIMCVWRFTYGFNRKEHAMSLSFIMNHTGLNRSRVNDSLKKLLDHQVIIKTIQGDAKTSSSYSFNKDYEQWKLEKYACFVTSEQIDTSVQSDTSTSVQSDTSTSVQSDTQERYIKDIFKESSSSSGEEQFAEIMNFYQNNLQRGVTETPFNLELIVTWFDEFGYELLLASMKVAAKAEAKGVNFTEGVLKKWKEAGVKDLEDARKYQKEFKNRGKTKGKGQQNISEGDFDLND